MKSFIEWYVNFYDRVYKLYSKYCIGNNKYCIGKVNSQSEAAAPNLQLFPELNSVADTLLQTPTSVTLSARIETFG